MKLLIDTNIILDVLLNRKEHCDAAVKILSLTERNDIKEYVSASAITDIYYIAQRQLRDKSMVRTMLRKLISVVSIAGVSVYEITNALELEWNDFEDSVQYSVALLNDMDGIVTRNPGDYSKSTLKIWQPQQLLTEIGQTQDK